MSRTIGCFRHFIHELCKGSGNGGYNIDVSCQVVLDGVVFFDSLIRNVQNLCKDSVVRMTHVFQIEAMTGSSERHISCDSDVGSAVHSVTSEPQY